MSYKDVAGRYLQAGWKPIPARGKSPVPPGATGENGVVDSDRVFQWSLDAFWNTQNVALRAEGWIGIDVDDYERVDQETGEVKVKRGASELAEMEARLGLLPVTITSTARGADTPSRIHLYRIPDEEAYTAFIAKPSASIEIIQRRHRYALVAPSTHPDLPSATYAWYGYDGALLTEIPSIDDLEMLPEAWLEFLRAPEQERSGTGFSGNVQAWLEVLRPGDPSPRVQAFIADIPTGDFGHDVMTALAYRIVRLGAENEPGVKQGIEALRAQWLRGPYNTPEYRKGLDDAIDGAIKKAGAPEQPIPTMLPSSALIAVLNPHPHLGTLSTAAPANDDDAAEKRKTIATEAWKAGLADDQVLTLVWNSAAGRSAQVHGVDALWRELLPHRVEKGSTAEPAETSPKGEKPSFLRPKERELLDRTEWWGTRYLTWTRSQVKAYNAQYHHMMMWTILSLTLGPSARLPLGAKDVPLNIFGGILGPTTSGKTECIDLGKRVLRHSAPGVSIGGDSSVEALTEKLIERDGRSSWFNRDEAHGLIEEVRRGGSWQASNVQKWTELYEGRVPMMLRVSKQDLSGIEAFSNFVMTLIGTEQGMTDAIDADFWTSGFLARFVWAIGDTIEETEEILKVNMRRTPVAGGPSMAEQFAAELQRAKSTFPNDAWFYMDLSDEAEVRLNAWRKEIAKAVRGHHHYERLKPTSLRFQDNVLKCAALVALSEGSKIIDTWHLLVALDQAAEWWANILHMIDATDETRFIREVNRVERIIAGQVGKQMTTSELYMEARRQMSKRVKEADELVGQLVAEGRVLKIPQADGTTVLRISEAA